MAKKRKTARSKIDRGSRSKKESNSRKKTGQDAASRSTSTSRPSPRDGENKKKLKEPAERPVPTDAPEPEALEKEPDPRQDLDAADPELVVVAIGSSAGGLEVLSEILSALEPDTGAAYVIVQHLSPEHRSAMVELLSPKCSLRVLEARDGIQLEPNRVYVLPPNADKAVGQGTLKLGPRPEGRAGYTPINRFFASISEDATIRPVGVILTGTSSDGASGIGAIKAAGGITIAQDPATAKFDVMPRAAINTGMVDLVLTPGAIAEELNEIVRHPFIRADRPERTSKDFQISHEEFSEVFEILRKRRGVDFSQYKSPTIRRRLQRRLALHKIDGMKSYVQMLKTQDDEATALYNDLLIQVTSFFREPKALEALGETVLPKLIAERGAEDTPLRFWVPGCATGEEAYSLAIEVLDFLLTQKGNIPIQIFATDVSESAIERARAGVYPDTIEEEVSPERLRRYFVRTDGRFRVSKQIRDICVFARQDLTRDPPFSRLDLIVCRNVMIYLSQSMQKRLLTVFHYALKNGGYLLLGNSETAAPAQDLFSSVEKNVRLFTKKPVETPSHSIITSGRLPFSPATHRPRESGRDRDGGPSLQAEANRILLDRYSPPGVIVDDDMQIVHFRGKTGVFLEPAPGDASLNLLKMAREGLLYGLRSAIHKARQNKSPVRKEGLQVRHNGSEYIVDVEVTRLQADAAPYYLVVFHPRPVPAERPSSAKKKQRRGGGAKGKGPSQSDAADQLQLELNASREYLQSVIQDLEAANEELQSANEEILSSNEELQSTNEELDTAREELQSTNEELNTLNEELQGRNEELSRANSDLMNLLANVQIAIVMVSLDLRIRRFTPTAEKILNLIPSDVGRPIGHIKPNIECPDLEKRIAHVADAIVTDESEVQDRQGRWYSLRIRPYKDAENRIDGAVLSLFDVDSMKAEGAQLGTDLKFAEGVLETITQPIVVLNDDLTLRMANNAFCHEFQLDREDIAGRRIDELGKEQWQMPSLREALERVLPENETFENLIVEQSFSDGSRRIRLNGRRLEGVDERLILLAFEEVS
jgi:two-component system CheB/CheR fusion protein